MGELEKQDIYACALAMPTPDAPTVGEWVAEIARHIEANREDEIILVGHSLGVPAILRYLESEKALPISGAVLVSGPAEKNGNEKIDNFLEKPFDFEMIKSKAGKFVIIHGDNDPLVPLRHAEILSENLAGKLNVIPNGGHLNGSSGWLQLPEVLEGLMVMMN